MLSNYVPETGETVLGVNTQIIGPIMLKFGVEKPKDAFTLSSLNGENPRIFPHF